jgi:Ca2+-binding RTX toxin-like protein
MDTRQLIDNLFKSGNEFLGGQSTTPIRTAGDQNNTLSGLLSGKGCAALAGGTLSVEWHPNLPRILQERLSHHN